MAETKDLFETIKECEYKGERYSVRSDGAVMRHQREAMRKRKLDGVWSFGTLNLKTGYLDFCGERVHRIVATAFHGEAPSDQHVVDHIDTNRQNNRPENLRWLTKLENILLNEITRKKVELICGSIEAFLENPSLLYGYETEDANFQWMRNVTKEEAQFCLDNWTHWAKTAAPDPNYKKAESHVGDWIFKSTLTSTKEIENPFKKAIQNSQRGFRGSVSEPPREPEYKEEDFYNDSLTPLAKQYWRTPTEFPCCPNVYEENGLDKYLDNLKPGAIFSSNVYTEYCVVDRAKHPVKHDLIILCMNTKAEKEEVDYTINIVKQKGGSFFHECFMKYYQKDYASHIYKALIGEEEWTDDDDAMWHIP